MVRGIKTGVETRDEPTRCGRAWMFAATPQFFIPLQCPVSDKTFLITRKRWGWEGRAGPQAGESPSLLYQTSAPTLGIQHSSPKQVESGDMPWGQRQTLSRQMAKLIPKPCGHTQGPGQGQAHGTKPSFQPQPWSSCLPVPLSICITIPGRSGAAPQPNSWPLAKWIISSPFCPHVWLTPFAYSSFFPPPEHLQCRELEVLPAQQLSLLGNTNIPVMRMETDPLGQSPQCEGGWERGNEVGCYHLQVDLGTGVTPNTGIWENAALHKLGRKKKKRYILKLLFSCLRVAATILNSSCYVRCVSSEVQGLDSFVYAQVR